MRLTEFLSKSRILLELKAGEQAGALHELATLLSKGTDCPAEELEQLLNARERVSSTAIGEGLAVPHCRVEGATQLIACVALRRQGVDFGAPDGQPVRIFVALASPVRAAGAHLKVLARIVALLRDPGVSEALLEASSVADIHGILLEAEAAYVARQQTRADVHWPAGAS